MTDELQVTVEQADRDAADSLFLALELDDNASPFVKVARYYLAKHRIAATSKLTADLQRIGDERDALDADLGAEKHYHHEAKLDLQAAREALEAVHPYLDAIICYASTMEEHEGNRVAAKVQAALARLRGDGD